MALICPQQGCNQCVGQGWGLDWVFTRERSHSKPAWLLVEFMPCRLELRTWDTYCPLAGCWLPLVLCQVALPRVAHNLTSGFLKDSKGEGFSARRMLQSFVMSSWKWQPSPLPCCILWKQVPTTLKGRRLPEDMKTRTMNCGHIRDCLHIHYC